MAGCNYYPRPATQKIRFHALKHSMKASTDFLKAIGHTDKVYIRCLSPKNTPLSGPEQRGMTYKDKSNKVKKSTINGYIDLQTGEFYRRDGKEYKPVTNGWKHLRLGHY